LIEAVAKPRSIRFALNRLKGDALILRITAEAISEPPRIPRDISNDVLGYLKVG
jgi:hypothetical protein